MDSREQGYLAGLGERVMIFAIMKKMFVLFVLWPFSVFAMTAAEYKLLEPMDIGTVAVTQDADGNHWVWVRTRIKLAENPPFFIYACAATKAIDLFNIVQNRNLSMQEFALTPTASGWKVGWTSAQQPPQGVPAWCTG